MTLTIRFCPCCGTAKKPFAKCGKGCGDDTATGTMDEMYALQATYAAAHAPPPPSAEDIARAEEAARYSAAVREAASEARRASLAKTATPAARFARSTRPQWQRACTCGHCMTCIGE